MKVEPEEVLFDLMLYPVLDSIRGTRKPGGLVGRIKGPRREALKNMTSDQARSMFFDPVYIDTHHMAFSDLKQKFDKRYFRK